MKQEMQNNRHFSNRSPSSLPGYHLLALIAINCVLDEQTVNKRLQTCLSFFSSSVSMNAALVVIMTASKVLKLWSDRKYA